MKSDAKKLKCFDEVLHFCKNQSPIEEHKMFSKVLSIFVAHGFAKNIALELKTENFQLRMKKSNLNLSMLDLYSHLVQSPSLRIISIFGLTKTTMPIISNFGKQIFNEAKIILDAGGNVVINFAELESVSMSFFYACFGQLYELLGDTYDKRVMVVNMDKEEWKIKYDHVFLLGANPGMSASYSRYIYDLFSAE